MFRFYAVAPWTLLTTKPSANSVTPPDEGELRPVLTNPAVMSSALERVEYRGLKSADYAHQLLSAGQKPAIFAKSPNDLPALLRTADQLLSLARQESGERAQLWRCSSCSTRYAIPVSMLRTMSIRCERCGSPIALENSSAATASELAESHQTDVNACRESLAEFFREAMARGWPVLVEQTVNTAPSAQ